MKIGLIGLGRMGGAIAQRLTEQGFEIVAWDHAEKVTQLARGLEHEESRTAAAEALRGLIDAIVLTPEDGELKIELQGNLAAMLKAAQAQSSGTSLAPLGRWGDEKSPDDDDLVQIMLVAGAGCRQYRPPSTWWRHEQINLLSAAEVAGWRPNGEA